MKSDRNAERGITSENPRALQINLRHLRAFAAVGASGSISAAANVLCRSTSAVTRSIAELEASLGRRLFDRTGRGLAINAEGRLVLERAERIAQEFAVAGQQLARGAGVASEAVAAAVFGTLLNGRRLALVARLADLGSMPLVAHEIGVTQPAVSVALRDLESGLGTRLFERSTHGLVPTVAGDMVAFYFRRVLAELRHIPSELQWDAGALQGTVRIGALPLGRTHVLPQAIALLTARHLGLRVSTLEGPYDTLSTALRRGDIDFIFGALRDPAQADGLVQEPVFDDRLALIARAGHPLTTVDRIDFVLLRRQRWVLSREDAPSRELLNRFFASAGEPAPLPTVETGDLGIVRGLLLESDMITAISPRQISYEIESGCLTILDFPLDATCRLIGFSQRCGGLPTPGARKLMEEIRAVVETGVRK